MRCSSSLLLSRPALAKMGMVLNLPEDKAKILGKLVNLELTTIGKYTEELTNTVYKGERKASIGTQDTQTFCSLTGEGDDRSRNVTIRRQEILWL